jgi:hypothetical protein
VLIDDALHEEGGVISYYSKCLLCEEETHWYASVKEKYMEQKNKVKAEAIISKGLITSGNEKWAELTIYFSCSDCGIKNQVNGIKWKLS